MPRYLVDIMEIKITRKIVVAWSYETAKDFALRDVNVRAKGYTEHTIDAKVIKILEPLSSKFDEITQEQEQLKRE